MTPEVLEPHHEIARQTVQIGDRAYRDQGYGDWTGFYDWLRTSPEKIVGVRYWPFHNTRFLVADLSVRQYVLAQQDKACLEVYFSPTDQRIDLMASDDQAFGSNRVFCSQADGWAISFDTTGLSTSELHSIRDSGADWERLVAT